MFFEEGGATPDPTARLIRRDICPFDRVCDHLIVIDHAAPRSGGSSAPIGCCARSVAEAHFGFYSAGEFDIAPMLARHGGKRFLELGRSCVAKGYRSQPTLELMWRGIWTYVRHHRIDAMFGCASLEGAEPARHAAALSCLWRRAAHAEWRAPALEGRGVALAPLPAEAFDERAAVRALPPLIKGYWRLGAKFGAEAVDRSEIRHDRRLRHHAGRRYRRALHPLFHARRRGGAARGLKKRNSPARENALINFPVASAAPSTRSSAG